MSASPWWQFRPTRSELGSLRPPRYVSTGRRYTTGDEHGSRTKEKRFVSWRLQDSWLLPGSSDQRNQSPRWIMESQICLKEYESTGNSGLGQLEAHLQILMAGRVRHFHLIATDQGLVLRGQTR